MGIINLAAGVTCSPPAPAICCTTDDRALACWCGMTTRGIASIRRRLASRAEVSARSHPYKARSWVHINEPFIKSGLDIRLDPYNKCFKVVDYVT